MAISKRVDENIERALRVLLEQYPEASVKSALNRISRESAKKELTIIVNFGMHALPEDILKGETFFFSEGNVDLSAEGVKNTVELLSRRAVRFLRGKIWNKVYLVPSGHPLLVAMATLIVYRVTRLSPNILYYVDGEYREVELDVRADVVGDNTLK